MQSAVAGVWGRKEARALQGVGAGGDGTVYIDSVAEAAVLRVLEEEHSAGRSFQLISEEAGERSFGESGDFVVVDPIDGSHNAKMGIPYFSLTLAAARDRTYGSVYEGSVRNLATGDHFEATAGAGATNNGRRCHVDGDDAAAINVLQIEPTRLEEHMHEYVDLLGRAEKIRMLGSAALNICLVATGAVSLSLAPSLRSVDCAAPLLVLKEAGGLATDFDGGTIDPKGLGLQERTGVVAASNAALLELALDAIRMGRSAAARRG